ncbi:MAG: GHKL domain-containing protein [Niameybacter sp.]
MLTLNYRASFKKRITAVAFICFINICIEIIVVKVFLTHQVYMYSESEYLESYILIVIALVYYSVVMCLSKFKSIKLGGKVPVSYWICILLMPVGALYISLILFQINPSSNQVIITSVAFLLLMNFATFYLYEMISKAYTQEVEKKWIAQQNKYYEKQFQIMESAIKTTRTVKHDLKNHLYMVDSLLQRGEQEDAIRHIAQVIDVCDHQQEYAKSGNIAIDSILNFKLQEAEEQNIKVVVDLHIPSQIEVSSYDIAVILGNLLDNAIYAVGALSANRYINITIKYTKGRLIIKVQNSYKNEIQEIDGTICTTHKDKENHGIGLESVKMALEKYEGYLDIEYKNQIFLVVVFMYIKV